MNPTSCCSFIHKARWMGKPKRTTGMTPSAEGFSSSLHASCKLSGVIENAVASRQQTLSKVFPCSAYRFSTSFTTSARVAWSLAVSLLRMKGTSAPYCRATAAMASSSVLTITSLKQLLLRAASIGQARAGLPRKGRMFFPGMRLLPPRAVMMARLLKREKRGLFRLHKPVHHPSGSGTWAG